MKKPNMDGKKEIQNERRIWQNKKEKEIDRTKYREMERR